MDQQPATAPICALTLPQQIADHLGHRIMTGELPPGSRLKEEEFAELYDVSRGPVREAYRNNNIRLATQLHIFSQSTSEELHLYWAIAGVGSLVGIICLLAAGMLALRLRRGRA